MSTSRKNLIGATIVTAGIIGGAGTAFAFQGDPTSQGPVPSAERRVAMQKTFETGDHATWRSLAHGHVARGVTQETFPQFAEAHLLMREGKVAEAREILKKLGLNGAQGQGGMGRRMTLTSPST